MRRKGKIMKTCCKQWTSLVLTFVLLFSLISPAAAAQSAAALEGTVNGSAAYMLRTVAEPQVGSVGGEWAVIGLARSGYDVPQSYCDNYYAAVEDYVRDCGGMLHEKKYTEYSRVILALTAIGADPANVAGYNLLTPLGDFEKTVYQGVNGPIWALIALDSGAYDMPVNTQAKTQATRQMYVDDILSRQLANGGWNLTDQGGSGSADPDITAMALQALAPYRSQSAVNAAIDKALLCLSALQTADGGYTNYNSATSESVVQVIVALCALNIDLNDSLFVKGGNTLLDNLLSYRRSDGSFLHTSAGAGNNQMSSEQGLYGMVAALRFLRGESSLYQMNDVTIHVTGVSVSAPGLPGKNEAVQKVPVTMPGTTFSDIAGHANQEAIEALAERGIITGKGSSRFDPDATMTRAEFAAIIVRALGLTPQTSNAFTDVAASQWYAPYIGTAHAYGIINGVGGGKFNPGGTITRQEAAAMVARSAKLCGMDTTLSEGEQRDILAPFADYMTVSSWARESMAFCYSEGILDDSDLNVNPTRPILRCEIAQMLYNLLDSAKLL